ncbi:MAG: HPr family phosphocarrier protein [Elusimicrobia bacterium]|nr:HPr family phosphocarrier protein [Elusimicrobiota bacterium]
MSGASKLQKTYTVPNKLGLHARPAALFVQAVQRFRCSVLVAKGDTEVNGKSLMGLMMLAAEQGSQLRVTLDGADAAQALVELDKLFVRRFDEA